MSDEVGRAGRDRQEAEQDPAKGGQLELPSGRRLEVHLGADQQESIALKTREGALELKIRITDEGPVLELDAASMVLKTSGDMSFRCKRLALEAEESIALRSGGDLEQDIGGGYRCQVGQDMEMSTQAGSITARRGDLEVKANDDLALDGGRVMLNCPRPEEAERQARAVNSLKDLLDLPFQAPGAAVRLPRSEPVEEPGDEGTNQD